jgi:hypothetical protein
LSNTEGQKYEEVLVEKAQTILRSANRIWRELLTANPFSTKNFLLISEIERQMQLDLDEE